MKNGLILAIFTLTFSLNAFSQTDLRTEKEKFSYVVGYQIAQRLQSEREQIDVKILIKAIEDGLKGAPVAMTQEEMKSTLQAYQQKELEAHMALAKKNAEAGKEFLAANKKKEGVVELESGVQYRVIKEGSGKKPQAGDTVLVNYRGTLLNGVEFDSSHKHGGPTEIPLNRVIPGWREALQLMQEGAQWEVFIPAKLAYGARGASDVIGPNETLIFDIELVKVK
jgi:FKBP-type peptidyl-prolyl cis-trans isomerase FklB